MLFTQLVHKIQKLLFLISRYIIFVALPFIDLKTALSTVHLNSNL